LDQISILYDFSKFGKKFELMWHGIWYLEGKAKGEINLKKHGIGRNRSE
jgi:hypothetical protein